MCVQRASTTALELGGRQPSPSWATEPHEGVELRHAGRSLPPHNERGRRDRKLAQARAVRKLAQGLRVLPQPLLLLLLPQLPQLLLQLPLL